MKLTQKEIKKPGILELDFPPNYNMKDIEMSSKERAQTIKSIVSKRAEPATTNRDPRINNKSQNSIYNSNK